jgi:hypothetical protein
MSIWRSDPTFYPSPRLKLAKNRALSPFFAFLCPDLGFAAVSPTWYVLVHTNR